LVRVAVERMSNIRELLPDRWKPLIETELAKKPMAAPSKTAVSLIRCKASSNGVPRSRLSGMGWPDGYEGVPAHGQGAALAKKAAHMSIRAQVASGLLVGAAAACIWWGDAAKRQQPYEACCQKDHCQHIDDGHDTAVFTQPFRGSTATNTAGFATCREADVSTGVRDDVPVQECVEPEQDADQLPLQDTRSKRASCIRFRRNESTEGAGKLLEVARTALPSQRSQAGWSTVASLAKRARHVVRSRS
jgi:hypothetical protein